MSDRKKILNKVILGDCLTYMKTKADNYYDLAIVDPPYGIGAEKGFGRAKTNKKYINHNQKWDKSIPKKSYFDGLFRISKYQIIWGGNYFIDFLRPTPIWIIWDKLNPNRTFAEAELAWTSFNKKTIINRKLGVIRIFKYYTCKKDIDGDKIHPTQKPVALYKWILKNYAKPGQTIFDSHVGSGSIRIACHDLGFDFEGCELDKDYWEAQEKRYKQHSQQKELFPKEEIRDLIYD